MYTLALMMGFSMALLAASPACAASPVTPAPCCPVSTSDGNDVQTVLENLQERASSLQSLQARLDYVVRQPLLESQLRRKGLLYYAKHDGKSNLRINFDTLQQDEEPEQVYREQFLFDGVWLWHVDYQTERVERRQMSEPNEPIDAFALASRHVPVLGFSRVEDLRKQFDVGLVAEAQSSPCHHLHLTVKPDSVYKDDYTTVDFWVDRKLGLPTRIVAVTTEEDVHEIALLDPKADAEVNPEIFKISVPNSFSVEVIPLDRTAQTP